MLDAVILALTVATLTGFAVAGHISHRIAAYAGLLALAAVVILLAKSNILLPRPFNEAVRRIFPRSDNLFDRKNLLGWASIAAVSYVVSVLVF